MLVRSKETYDSFIEHGFVLKGDGAKSPEELNLLEIVRGFGDPPLLIETFIFYKIVVGGLVVYKVLSF